MTAENLDPKAHAQFEKMQQKRDRKIERGDEWKREIEGKLCQMLQSSMSHYNWSNQGLLQNVSGQQKVDFVGRPGVTGHLVFVEVEHQRITCVRNVIKVWMDIAAAIPDSQPVLLIQIFSPSFLTDKKRGKEEALFIGEQAHKTTSEKLTYRHIQVDYWPSKDATVLRGLVERIRDLVTEYEGSLVHLSPNSA